jgi:hypothetical protein
MIRVRIKNSLIGEDIEEFGLLDEPTYPEDLKRLGNGIMEAEIIKKKPELKDTFEDRWKKFATSSTPEEIDRLKKHLCQGWGTMKDLLKLMNAISLASKGGLDKVV